MADRIDWSQPLVAWGQDGKVLPVSIDRSYAESPKGKPIKLGRNLWSDTNDGGTWYFNDQGMAVGGISPDGYNGRYVLRNARGWVNL